MKIFKRNYDIDIKSIKANNNLSKKEQELLKEILPQAFIISEINKDYIDKKVKKNLFERFLERNEHLEIKQDEEDVILLYRRLKKMYEDFFNNDEVKEILRKERKKVFENVLKEEIK